MKTAKYSMLTVLLLLLALPGAWAQTGEPAEDPAEETEIARKGTAEVLLKVLKLSKAQQYEDFAKIMIYSGPNPDRQLCDLVNMRDPHDKVSVINAVNRIHHYMETYGNYAPENFRIAKGGSVRMFVWDVVFTPEKKKPKTLKFTFIQHRGHYVFCSAE